ncbi:MAG: C39 family peptidase, partial [Nitrospiraceae bacterium]
TAAKQERSLRVALMSKYGPIGAVLALGLGVLLLIGCVESPLPGSAGRYSETRSEQIQQTADYPDSPGQAVRVVVPFFPDGTDQCGPATLASVLMYWGIPSEPAVLKAEMYRPQLGGTLPIDFLLVAQARGLQTEGSSGTLESLKTELDAHHPVIALLNLGWTVFPQGHYVVITGYDERQQGVYMHSGLARDLFVSYTEFIIYWEKTGRWMLRLQPMERHVTVLDRIDRMDE